MVVVGGTCMRLRYLITKKVKEYREKAGISQIDLSRKLGKPDDFMSMKEVLTRRLNMKIFMR